ncbi:MAG: sigma-70 family RNA polymerase sigma factor [Actinomycetota bacterium]
MVRQDPATTSTSGLDPTPGLWGLFDAHGRDVYRFVHRRCGDASMAEEVTQDVFLAAIDASPDEVEVGWLYRVARNRMIDLLRRQDTLRTKLHLVGAATEVDDHAIAVADRVRLERALARLSTMHRSVLMLFHVDGMSVRDLAGQLERSERGVEALLMRARTALRDELEATDE